jgi:hypothetical protein
MKTLTEVKANATRAEIALTAGHQILRSLGSAFRIRHFGRRCADIPSAVNLLLG